MEFKPVPPPVPAARTVTRVFKAFSKEAEDEATAAKQQHSCVSRVLCAAAASVPCFLVVLLWQGKLISPQATERKAQAGMPNGSGALRRVREDLATISNDDDSIVGEDTATHCSAPGEDCSLTHCCFEADMVCYSKNLTWACCRKDCGQELSEDGSNISHWNCTTLSPGAPNTSVALVTAAPESEPRTSEHAGAGNSELHAVGPLLAASVV